MNENTVKPFPFLVWIRNFIRILDFLNPLISRAALFNRDTNVRHEYIHNLKFAYST